MHTAKLLSRKTVLIYIVFFFLFNVKISWLLELKMKKDPITAQM